MGFPKASIEANIARGQGISPSGAALEQLTVEFMVSENNVAGLIECETDSKPRTMQHIRDTIKYFGGTLTTTAYMFDRRGKIVFTREDGRPWDEEELLEMSIEAGAEDVDIEDNEAVILTEPNEITAVAEALSTQLNMKPESQDLVWIPKEDMAVNIGDTEAQQRLDKFIEKLEEDPTIQELYLNRV